MRKLGHGQFNAVRTTTVLAVRWWWDGRQRRIRAFKVLHGEKGELFSNGVRGKNCSQHFQGLKPGARLWKTFYLRRLKLDQHVVIHYCR